MMKMSWSVEVALSKSQIKNMSVGKHCAAFINLHKNNIFCSYEEFLLVLKALEFPKCKEIQLYGN